MTLTTVGYGDVGPTATEGGMAATVLKILDVRLFAAIAGTITSRYVLADD